MPWDNQPLVFSVMKSVDSSVDQTAMKGGGGGSNGEIAYKCLHQEASGCSEHSNSPDPLGHWCYRCACVLCVCVYLCMLLSVRVLWVQ